MSASFLYSQTLSDALRLSYFNPAGTARTLAVGGSMSAIGGDFGSLNLNPAGIGTYRSGEFIFTPGIYSSQTSSTLSNQLLKNEENPNISLKIANVGMVFHHKPIASNWKTSNFVIGLNNLNDLNQSFLFKGTSRGSITERFVERANGKTVDEFDNFEAFPAWETYAIDPITNENNLYKGHIGEDDEVYKEQIVDSRGRVSELFFGFGGNLNEKLQFGASVGVPLVRYREEKSYTEVDPDNSISNFESLNYIEYLNTTGSGINAKAGVIFMPIRQIRLGAAIHSPNYYVLTDNYYTELTYVREGQEAGERNYRSVDGTFKYRIASPWRVMGSFGSVFNLGSVKGLLNADIEYLDYRNAYFNLSAYNASNADRILQDDLNDQVETQFKSAMNYRLGVELASGAFRIRGGFHMNGSPYGEDTESTYFTGYTLGIGHRGESFFIDAAYRLSSVNEGYIPYLVLDQDRLQLVENNITNQNFVVTFGFKI